MNDAPILIAYDSSDSARRAVHEAGKLYGPRRAVVVTVWEPDLGYEVAAMSSPTDLAGAGPGAFDVAEAQEINDALRTRAERIAHEGAQLARSVGLEVSDAVAMSDKRNVADAILELARARGAAAIIIGSRGLSGLRARLAGSTSNAVRKHAACPVVVVHDD